MLKEIRIHGRGGQSSVTACSLSDQFIRNRETPPRFNPMSTGAQELSRASRHAGDAD